MIRTDVERRAHYLEYRSVLRHDCWYSCAYCSIAETEAFGIGFHIDHYDPTESDREMYENLFWACAPCNEIKSDFWDYNVNARDEAYRILRIDQQHPRDHLELNGLRVNPLTDVGETTEIVLRLNRKQLRDLREARRNLNMGQEMIMEGLRVLLDSASLDALSPGDRRAVLALRSRAQRQVEQLCSCVEELVAQAARSSYLDDDPTAELQRRVRRDFLSDIGALAPDTTAARRAGRRLSSAGKKKRGAGGGRKRRRSR